MNDRIYLNNGATSYPKPKGVAEAVADFIIAGGANFSRGTASESDIESMSIILDVREGLCSLLGGTDSSLVTFTLNVTQSVNTVLKGFVRGGMRVITSSMEHNAVIRPLRSLEKAGAEVCVISCDKDGYLAPEDLEAELMHGADLVIMNCASNVCGSLQDIGAIGDICKRAGVPLVLDAAQAAGHTPVSASELGAAAVCFTGHKGLLGPQGTGGIVWNESFAKKCAPFCEGGTGSFSHEQTQPEVMPDKFESGTPNMPGLAGLNKSVRFILDTGISKIAAREDDLAAMLWDGIERIDGVRIFGSKDRPRVPVIAIELSSMDNARAADILQKEYGIETRPGLHCAPLAHQTIGTFPTGVLRLSPGYFTTEREIDIAIDAISKIA